MPFALFVASANRPLDDDDDGALLRSNRPRRRRTGGVPERGMDAVPRRARLVQAPRQAGFKVRTRVLTDLARSNKRARGVDRASTVVFDAALRRAVNGATESDAERRLAISPPRVDRTARS